MPERYVVIMAGGRGERFWPQSRLKRPKQLLPIVGDKPMLAQTVDRLRGMVEPDKVFVITNEEQREAVLDVCPDIPEDQVIGEPVGRDTAPAVGLATVLVQRRDPDATYAMLPADAVIHNAEGFQKILGAAFEAAEKKPEALVTIGIKPDYPATGYGYIQKGEVALEAAGENVYQVQRFVEKPDEPKAKEYLDSGEYYWNAGMFIWKSSAIGGQLAAQTPELWQRLQRVAEGIAEEMPLQALLEEHYPHMTKISIDFAVMEKAPEVLTIESSFDWDDVGEWPAVARHHEADAEGNVVKGKAVIKDGKGNIVINSGGHLTALIGVDDLIVVQTADATLVCPKDRAQDIKAVVKEIGENPDYKHLM